VLEPTLSTSARAVSVSNVTVASGRSYQVVSGGLSGGARRYTDRSFTISSPVPSELQGATFIRTANDDKSANPGASSFLSFEVSQNVTVYVAHDDRLARPAWLKSGWEETSISLQDSDGMSNRFRVFRRSYPRGKVTLGSNVPTQNRNGSMYTVAVKAGTSTATATAVEVSNISVTTGRSYRTARGLAAGTARYVDRSFTLGTIPAALQGATFIRTANDDKGASPGSSSFLRFDVDRDVTVYVAHDDRLARPAWLGSGWQQTSLSLRDTDPASAGFRVFRRDFARGRVTLGSNVPRADNSGSMYTVVVTPRSSAPQPTQPATVATNECANPQPGWIFCDDFEQDRFRQYFEYDARNGAFTRAAGAGRGGSTGMRARWSAGQVNAGSLKLAFGRTPSTYMRPVDDGTRKYRSIYWRVYVRNQPGWTGGGADKLSRATVFAGSNWSQAMIAHVWSGGSSSTRSYLVVDPASGTSSGGSLRTTKYNDFANLRWLGLRRGATPIFAGDNLGKWHCVEAHVRLNDAGRSNGVFRLWVNGSLDAERTGMNWLGSYDRYGINAVLLENYWNNGSPKAQERYLDNFVVSTSRIGC
jgi:hypothetical protein